jgi:hypothetical protein
LLEFDFGGAMDLDASGSSSPEGDQIPGRRFYTSLLGGASRAGTRLLSFFAN